jgi:hypothetical protein
MKLNQVKDSWKQLKVDFANFWGELDCDLPILNKTQQVSYANKRTELVSRSQKINVLSDDERAALQISDYQYYLSLGDRPSVAWLKAHGARHRRSSD